jgi:hypothetical protein
MRGGIHHATRCIPKAGLGRAEGFCSGYAEGQFAMQGFRRAAERQA